MKIAKLKTLRRVAPIWTEMIETMDQLPVSNGFQEFQEMYEMKCPDLRRAETCIKGEVWDWKVNIDCFACSLHGARLYLTYKCNNSMFKKQLLDFQEHIELEHRELLA